MWKGMNTGMKFDSLLAEVNGFGKYQILILFLLLVPRVILPCQFLLNIFIAAIPSHHCNISALEDQGVLNLTREQQLRVYIPVQDDGSLSSCEMFPEPQLQFMYGSSNRTDTPTVPCQNGWVYDTTTFSSTIATEWDLVCNKRGLNKATATIFFVGVMSGAVVFGYLCDRFGRKSMLLVSYVLGMTFGLASAFSRSYLVFAVMRFLTGFGLTGISIISIVLCIEWVDIEHRTVIGVIGSMCWTFGNIALAGIAYAISDWRYLMIAVTAPLGLAVISWWWLPESARWLIANGKVERAYLYLQKCAKYNRMDDFASKIKPETLSSVVTADNQNRSYTYWDLVKTPKIRRMTVFTGIVWFGVAITYYGISLNITGFGLNIYLTHFIYATIELPSKIIIYFFLNKIGRRYCQAGTLVLTGTCIAINIFAPKEMWHLRTLVAVLGKGLSEASFTTVFLYTTELYPTVVRQNGIGYTSFMARLGGSIAPLVMLLDDVWKILPEIIFCATALLSGLVALLLPETHNKQLPESIGDIENTKEESHQDRSSVALTPLPGEPAHLGFDGFLKKPSL